MNYNKAIRYLNDLVLQSDMESSDFDVILEQNSSVEGSSKYLGSEDRSFPNPCSLLLHINSKSKGNSKLSTESLPISIFNSKENEQKRSSSCYNFVPKSSFDNFNRKRKYPSFQTVPNVPLHNRKRHPLQVSWHVSAGAKPVVRRIHCAIETASPWDPASSGKWERSFTVVSQLRERKESEEQGHRALRDYQQ